MVALDWELGKWRVTASGHGVSSGDNENILKLGYGNGCTTLNILKNTELYTLKVQYVNYIL